VCKFAEGQQDGYNGAVTTPADPVVIVSNRGPVQHERAADGSRVTNRGGGGLVTALSGLAGQLDDAVWVCAALTDEDLAVSREHGGEAFPADERGALRVRMVELDPEAQRKHYSVISNPLLWFLQHYLWDLANAPDIDRDMVDAFETGYVAVNERMAEAVAEEVEARGGRATVLLQDYHLYLVPQVVRQRCPQALLHHFVHIPWPQPDSWRMLPPAMREALLVGMLGNDVVGFHTERFARNFLLCCQELLDRPIDLRDLTVDVGGRTVRARWYPISVDAGAFEDMAASAAVEEKRQALEGQRRDHLVLRVDRTDPSKNIVRGFRAFDILLEDHPELLGKVTFLALLQPSRQDVAEYADYVERIRRTVADVNLKHGSHDWQPIDLRLEEDLEQAVAAYTLFDVLVVNSVFDGMNLVAKEAILVNRRDGVLALSENTGAHEELGAFAVTLHPFDVQQQADALHEALTMAPEDRRNRREACAAVVRRNDVARWLTRQLRDLEVLSGAAEDT
jgi:trehalose 6-phosphate synthase